MSISTHILGMGIERLLLEASKFVPQIQKSRLAMGAIEVIAERARAALQDAPNQSSPYVDGRLSEIRNMALSTLENTLDDMLELTAFHATLVRRLESLQTVVLEEIRHRRAAEDSSEELPDSPLPPDDNERNQPGDGASGAGLPPPPSYHSDSTHDANASPSRSSRSSTTSESSNEDQPPPLMEPDHAPPTFEVERPSSPESALWRASHVLTPSLELMNHPALNGPTWVGAISAVQNLANETPGELNVTPAEAIFGPAIPEDSAASSPHSTHPRRSRFTVSVSVSILARRITGKYYSSLQDQYETEEGNSWWVYGTDYDDMSPGELQWTFGEGLDLVEEDWLEFPLTDAANFDGFASASPQSHSDSEPSCPDRPLSPEIEVVDTAREVPEPGPNDELVIRSVSNLLGSRCAERCSVFVDHRGLFYTVATPLPEDHYLSPAMHPAHLAAMEEAIRERAEELHTSQNVVRSLLETALTPDGIRERRGFLDTAPRLLLGLVYHECVATQDPDLDDDRTYPGFCAQALAHHVEHVARVTRPPRIGVAEPPNRDINKIACLTAELEIGGVKAYVLFDSGSNTDSVTPEFAKTADCKIFRLDEQVTLQLGCVSSKSKISFGARAPVNFGGIKGHAYYDIVNLDRYDAIIGTPFMIKHGLVLDFGKRQVIFPNGHIVPSLTVMQDLSVVKTRLESAARSLTPRK
ncbi:hypothetical protein B0H13DRAFT_2343498 [Mycena leptocephala]|nr:hypothetical protein B0H13DRAFT_2343498 [Mycena leptocephala]